MVAAVSAFRGLRRQVVKSLLTGLLLEKEFTDSRAPLHRCPGACVCVRAFLPCYFARTSNEYPPSMRTAKSGLIRKDIILGYRASLAMGVFPLSTLTGV